MNALKKPFKHNGKFYEVRAALIGDTWEIAIYSGDQRIGGVSTLKDEVKSDAAKSGVKRLLDEAMAIIEDEFRNGTAFEVAIAVKKAIADERAAASKSGH
jgi:hypothetical protein